MIRVHTNHINNSDSFLKPIKEGYELTERDKQRAYMLLGLIKKKVKYKQQDLFRDKEKNISGSVLLENIEDVVREEGKEYRFAQEWLFLLENPELIEALKSLSYYNQELLWLLFVEEKTQKEIAEKFQVSPASVSQAKKRAYKKIRSFMKERGD